MRPFALGAIPCRSLPDPHLSFTIHSQQIKQRDKRELCLALPSTETLRHTDDDSTDTLSPAARTADDSLCPLYFNAAFEPSYKRLMKVRVVWSRASVALFSRSTKDARAAQARLRHSSHTKCEKNWTNFFHFAACWLQHTMQITANI